VSYYSISFPRRLTRSITVSHIGKRSQEISGDLLFSLEAYKIVTSLEISAWSKKYPPEFWVSCCFVAGPHNVSGNIRQTEDKNFFCIKGVCHQNDSGTESFTDHSLSREKLQLFHN